MSLRALGGFVAALAFLVPAATRAEDGPSLVSESIEADATQSEARGSWVDSSHEYATNRAQALAQWMDDFFGLAVQDAERADSFIRVIGLDEWDSKDDHDLKLRVRGQVSLPKVSERVDLVFSGEENETSLTEEERAEEDNIGVRVNFRDSARSRLDATISVRSGPALLPGVRYRYQQPITDNSWYRVTQRLQYHTEDGYRAITNVDLNRFLDEDTLVRLAGRVRWEEDKGFWEWNSDLRYRQWLTRDHERYPTAVEYFVGLSGRHNPGTFNNNYRVGVLYRRQFFRDFLYYEVEPTLNWRRDEFEDKREVVLGVVLRLEVMLDSDLVRGRRSELATPKR